MKRFVSMLLAVVMIFTMIPVVAQAAQIGDEDVILDYGSFDSGAGIQSIEQMASTTEKTFVMSNIPSGASYKKMYPSQKIIDIIKDFEGFRSKAYWDNSQWTYGYGTRAPSSGATISRAEAERLLVKVLNENYGKTVNDFCRKNGKQPTQQQFDALLDLTYNVGGSWTTGSSVPNVILKPVTALELVKGFGAWCRSGGGVSYVHANRRIREALIYLYGEYYLAYGNQDCKSNLKVVDNDDLPRFKAVIFKTTSGMLENGKSDYAGYYPVGQYYGSFIEAKRSGYTLVGWKITKRSNSSVYSGERISCYDKVKENLELTAVWEKGTFTVAPETPPADYMDPVVSGVLPFTDVAADTWFRDAVSFVYNRGYMNGVDSDSFDPSGAMTRGMLVTVLYRMDGSAPVSDRQRACFDDIAGAYYTDAVAWAHANGIVNGVSDSKFEPDRVVTRQEAVTIFYRYCVDYNQVALESGLELNGFKDKGEVAGFATDAFAWAVTTGLVEGTASGSGMVLNPTGTLNRAQAAVLLQRCVEDIM